MVHLEIAKRFYLSRNTVKPFNLDEIVKNKTPLKRGHELLLYEDDGIFSHLDLEKEDGLVAKELSVAVIPCYTKEDELDIALQSLQDQTEVPDWILVILNGPEPKNGGIAVAEKQAKEFAQKYSNIEVIKSQEKGKVNALNFSFKYMIEKIYHYKEYEGIALHIPYILYMDADIRCDARMIEHLHEEIVNTPDAAGVMARYSFEFSEGKKYSSSERSFLYGQRIEFAMKTAIQQVRRQTEILGGQGTLFRQAALIDAAKHSFGRVPWSISSKVEDAELTKVLQGLGYKTLTSYEARAWVGPMLNSHSWNKQRQKWQDGHLEDLSKSIHPYRDRYRLSEQFLLGWNLIIRGIFFAVMPTGLIMGKFKIDDSLLLWLIPIGLSSLLTFSVAKRIPNAGTWEKLRSLLYLPGEIYYLRTLSVWLNSVVVLFFGFSRDGWGNQDAAESSQKKTNLLSWVILAFFMLVISCSLFSISYINMSWFNKLYQILWSMLTSMTILSCVFMVKRWFSIFRARSRVRP